MLIKHAIRALVLLAAVSTSINAQTAFWFEQNVNEAASRATKEMPITKSLPVMGFRFDALPNSSSSASPAPASAASSLPKWIESNKIPDAIPQAAAKPTKEFQKLQPETNSLPLAPWPKLGEMPKPMADVPATVANKNPGTANPDNRLPQVFEEPAALKTDGRKEISTQLSSRALKSGEIETDFRWSSAVDGTTGDSSFIFAAAAEASSAAEQSLIVPVEYLLARPLDERSKEESEETDNESMSELVTKYAAIQAKQSEAGMKSDPEAVSPGAKFDTASMIGPLLDPQKLFTQADVTDDFQAYAITVPADRNRDQDSPYQAPFTSEYYNWVSPVFYSKPLYFEQPNLERYGLGTRRCLQPIASSVHFFGTIPLLPYKMLTQHPCEKYYTLGNNRPGSFNPVQKRVILGQSHLGEVLRYWDPHSGY